MPPADVEAIEAFVHDVPELAPKWHEHLADYGEPLPHVFFGDVARFGVKVAEGADAELPTRFCSGIERLAASDDPEIDNVIQVSFVEYLVWGNEHEQHALATLRRDFGPATLRRIREFEEWSANATPPGIEPT